MKKRLNKIKLMVIFVAIVEILCLVEFSYSRFKSTRAGDLNGRVLKWHFELVDGVQETEEIDFPITRIDDNEDVPEGMIAPGTYGEIPIVINTTGCETNMECEIELTIENCPTNMMFGREILDDYQYFDVERIGTGEENDPKIAKFKYNFSINSENSGILEKSIFWNWEYETDWIIENGHRQEVDIKDSDQQDIIDQRNDITFNIKVTGKQIVTSPVYALLKDDTLILRDYDFSDEEKSTYIYYGDCCSENEPAWYRNKDEIVNVNIETPISPRKTDFWFFDFRNLVNISNIENLDTSNVTDMTCMFSGCESLAELDVSNFNTSNVIYMSGMFDGCSSLTELDLSNFDTSNVTYMSGMFSNCSSLTELDLSNFDTSNVSYMNDMFYYCSSLTELDLSNFNTSNVTDMYFMFYQCSSLTELDLFNFDTSNVTYMSGMFSNCSSLTELDLSNFDTSNVPSMEYMFSDCSSLTELKLSSFDTLNVWDMNYMFANCSSLTELNLSNFDTSNVTYMSGMFYNCSSLTELNLSSFDTSNVTKMDYMFYGCTNLVTIYVRTFDTSKVVKTYDSYKMFDGCYSLVGGSGTTYWSSYTGKTYARIDNPPSSRGYFTLKTS